MTDRADLRAEAARLRAAASQRRAAPSNGAKRGGLEAPEVRFTTEFRAEKVEKDGQEFYLVEGYASMSERRYEMWDMFGPYEEEVSSTAFDETLAADPMVIFRFNHDGASMANTRNGRLELWADSLGLGDRAWINPQRQDVQELVTAIRDQDVTEQSFMFMIEDGEWNDDYTVFRINRVNLDRGDVGPVAYGANPHTIIAARSAELLTAIPNLSQPVAREVYDMLVARGDVTPQGLTPVTYNLTLPAQRGIAPPDVTFIAPEPAAEAAPETPARSEEPSGMSLDLALAQLELDKHNA